MPDFEVSKKKNYDIDVLMRIIESNIYSNGKIDEYNLFDPSDIWTIHDAICDLSSKDLNDLLKEIEVYLEKMDSEHEIWIDEIKRIKWLWNSLIILIKKRILDMEKLSEVKKITSSEIMYILDSPFYRYFWTIIIEQGIELEDIMDIDWSINFRDFFLHKLIFGGSKFNNILVEKIKKEAGIDFDDTESFKNNPESFEKMLEITENRFYSVIEMGHGISPQIPYPRAILKAFKTRKY